MSIADIIRKKIETALSPCTIMLEDQSAKHAGHAGARPGGETHFYLEITSPAFEGLSPVARQRQIHALLAEELKNQVHALSLNLKTPIERKALNESS